MFAVAACGNSTDSEDSTSKGGDGGAAADGSASRPTLGGGGGALDGSTGVGEGGTGSTSPGADSGPGMASGPGTVSGTLAYQGGTAGPAAGVEVRVRDMSGAGRFAVTDATGAFSFTGVVAPYDLHFVTPYDGSGEDYLGLRATTVALKTSNAGRSGASLTNNYFMSNTIPVTLPNCGASECSVTWGVEIPGQALSFFGEGGVGSTNSYSAAAPPATLEYDFVQWSGPATATGIVRMVVSGQSATGTMYFYGEANATISTTSGITLAAAIAPAGVSTNVIAVTLDRSTLPAAQTVNLGATVATGGSTLAFPVPQTAISATSVSVPALPSGTLSLFANATGSAFGTTTSSVAGALTIPSAMLTMLAPPEFTAPVTGSTIADRDAILWSGQPAGTVCALGLSNTMGYSRTAYTSGETVALSELLALDGTIPAGTLTLSVSTFAPNGDIDTVAMSGVPQSPPEHATGGAVTATRAAVDAGVDGG